MALRHQQTQTGPLALIDRRIAVKSQPDKFFMVNQAISELRTAAQIEHRKVVHNRLMALYRAALTITTSGAVRAS